MRISAILLAAGNSRRFQGNKLLTPFQGKPLYRHTVDKVLSLPLQQILLVTQYEEMVTALSATPVKPIWNPHPEEGISGSIRLGLEHCSPCDGFLFFVCDQPMLSLATLHGMLSVFQEHPHCMIPATSQGQWGNPVLFPSSYAEELSTLTGEQGGRVLLQAHSDQSFLSKEES